MEPTENTDKFDGFIVPTINWWSHLEITTKLSSSARNLLDVFVTFMRTEDNLVCFTCGGMEGYLQFCSEYLDLNYTEKTVRNAISELHKAHLLLRAKKNIYYINPMYFFKRNENKDYREIINFVSERTGVNIWDERTKRGNTKKKEEQYNSEYNK